jgi:predicted ATP-dependent protease
MEKDVLIIRTEGHAVGQVNGLSVMDLGYHSFGKPTLITATTSVGQSGIINIEREARLSGGIYDKGVLIIAGYLRRMFAQERPLALTASLCFEQSYAGVDGDSASIAEIFALLSELSGIPLSQGIAVTGSISQRGQIQPVGGVNEKIEGYFDLCDARGLTGEQGVILPRRNVGDLMLRNKVVNAVAEGKFHVWGISSVEDGIEILSGTPAGVRDEDGDFPEGTVFRAAEDKLLVYLDALHGREDRDDWKPLQTVSGTAAAPGAPPEPGLPPRDPPVGEGPHGGGE